MESTHNLLNKRPGIEDSRSEEYPFKYQLPSEIVMIVFSNLDFFNMQAPYRVSQGWRQFSLDRTKELENKKIIKFLTSLAKNLDSDKYAEQKTSLSSLLDSNDILSSSSLIQVKSHSFNLGDSMIKVLKTLKEEDLNHLEKIFQEDNLPYFFERIFEVSRICKSLDAAHEITNNEKRASIRILIERGYIDIAIEYALTIENRCLKVFVVKDIAKKLLKQNQIVRILEIVNSLLHEHTDDKNDVFKTIVKYYINHKQIDQLMSLLPKLSSFENLNCKTQDLIIDAFSNNNRTKQALEFAQKIPLENSRKRKLFHLIQGTLKKTLSDSDIHLLIDVILSIDFGINCLMESQNDVLIEEIMINRSFIQNNRQTAIKLASAISEPHNQKETLQELVKDFIKDADYDNALLAAYSMSTKDDTHQRDLTLSIIVREFIKIGQIKKAIEVTGTIICDAKKDSCAFNLINELIKNHEFTRAEEKILPLFTESYIREMALKSIQEARE